MASGRPMGARASYSRAQTGSPGASTTTATGAGASSTPRPSECGVSRPRPYDLRHSFASLLLHERRLSIVEIAEQLGHSPTTTLKIYAHVIAELRDAPPVPAEDSIRAARRFLLDEMRTPGGPHDLAESSAEPSVSALQSQALYRTRTDDPFLTMEDEET